MTHGQDHLIESKLVPRLGDLHLLLFQRNLNNAMCMYLYLQTAPDVVILMLLLPQAGAFKRSSSLQSAIPMAISCTHYFSLSN